jgi:hypothetical protein
MKNPIILPFLVLGLLSCSSGEIKEKINKAGDIAGQATGEFVEGATKGIEKAFDVKVEIGKDIESKGIQFGKSTVSNDSLGTDIYWLCMSSLRKILKVA